MVPTIDSIIRLRYLIAMWLRITGLAFCAIASIWLVYVAVRFAITPSQQTWIYWAYEPLAYAVMFLIPGLLMFRLAGFLSRLLAPMPRLICPQCAHSLFRLAEPRCPECGCQVPQSYVTRGDRPQM